ncbi:MAG: nitrite/sulfite reductase [Verrucomicrobiae bacterium]|nr:nitrite/sulfite reductase [Verrucomicrobiae bacterium]
MSTESPTETPPAKAINFAAVKSGELKRTAQEQLKLNKDGLDVIHDLYRFAKTGFASIPDDDFERLKWYGVYRQRPKDSGFFMLRTKIPGGQLNNEQARAIASIAADYGRGFLDVTTRQTFQMHWLKIENFPDIFARLESVGMTTSGACGDDTRNVVGCPLAGIDKHELFDATPYLRAVSDFLTNNRDFSNLPRKYKIAIGGCSIECQQPDINCCSLFGVRRKDGTLGFGVKVGGGLSSSPHFAQTLDLFVPLDVEKVVDTVRAISEVFRDEGYREKRSRARFKFLVADWGAERMTQEVRKRMEWTPDPAETWEHPIDPESDHFGVHEQKEAGLSYVSISCLGGRIGAAELFQLLEIAARHGSGNIRTTNKQNIVLLDIPNAKLDAIKRELDEKGFVYQPSNFRQGCVSCTGVEFCNLAVAETKNRMMALSEQLESLVPEYRGKIRIHFSGCPSSCGQHQIADIGFRGGVTRIDGEKVDAFEMYVGGRTGKYRRFNELVKGKIPSRDIHLYIRKLLKFYEAGKKPEGECLGEFLARTPREAISAALEKA